MSVVCWGVEKRLWVYCFVCVVWFEVRKWLCGLWVVLYGDVFGIEVGGLSSVVLLGCVGLESIGVADR